MTGGHPLALPSANHTAPVPRRIRAVLNGRVVVDTISALYVWEWSHYPQYYIPVGDIDPVMLVYEQHEQKLSRATARRYALQVGEIVRPAALRIYGDDATVEGLAGRARFELGFPGCLVRGGRAGLCPSPRPLHPRRRGCRGRPAASALNSTA